METVIIDLMAWGLRENQEELANKIFQAIAGHAAIENVEYASRITDAKRYEPLPEDRVRPRVAFGDLAYRSITGNDPKWMLPELSKLVANKENIAARAAAAEQIKTIGQELKVYVEKLLAAAQIHIETPEGITIGLANTDIMITESEADYLKRLKDLLGGSKMVITKGDLRIEVSD